MPGAAPAPDVLRALEEEQEAAQAWKRQGQEALAEMRMLEAGDKLRPIIERLDELSDPRRGFRSEEAGAGLARITGKGRALDVLRDSIAWLQAVLEEAERAEQEEGR